MRNCTKICISLKTKWCIAYFSLLGYNYCFFFFFSFLIKIVGPIKLPYNYYSNITLMFEGLTMTCSFESYLHLNLWDAKWEYCFEWCIAVEDPDVFWGVFGINPDNYPSLSLKWGILNWVCPSVCPSVMLWFLCKNCHKS